MHEQKRNESLVFLLFPAKIRLKRALNRYKNSLISKPNKKNSQAGKIRFISMFGCGHPFPFWVHPFALFCTHRKWPWLYLVVSGITTLVLSYRKRPVTKDSKKKSCNKKRRHHDKRLPLLFFSKLMFVTVGGRPGRWGAAFVIPHRPAPRRPGPSRSMARINGLGRMVRLGRIHLKSVGFRRLFVLKLSAVASSHPLPAVSSKVRSAP